MDPLRRNLVLGALTAAASLARRGRADSAPPHGDWARDTLLQDTRYETAVHWRSTGRPGPLVLVTGGVHGNEKAGPPAAEALLSWAFQRGEVWLVPRVNQPALAANRRETPGVEHGDLNRNFPRRKSAADATRGELAPVLWRFVLDLKPDWLLDLHEGYAINRQNKSSVGSSVIYPRDDLRPQAERMRRAVNETIDDLGKHFTLLTPPRAGSLVRAAANRGVHALVLETTRKRQPLKLRVAQHHAMLRRFFQDQNML